MIKNISPNCFSAERSAKSDKRYCGSRNAHSFTQTPSSRVSIVNNGGSSNAENAPVRESKQCAQHAVQTFSTQVISLESCLSRSPISPNTFSAERSTKSDKRYCGSRNAHSFADAPCSRASIVNNGMTKIENNSNSKSKHDMLSNNDVSKINQGIATTDDYEFASELLAVQGFLIDEIGNHFIEDGVCERRDRINKRNAILSTDTTRDMVQLECGCTQLCTSDCLCDSCHFLTPEQYAAFYAQEEDDELQYQTYLLNQQIDKQRAEDSEEARWARETDAEDEAEYIAQEAAKPLEDVEMFFQKLPDKEELDAELQEHYRQMDLEAERIAQRREFNERIVEEYIRSHPHTKALRAMPLEMRMEIMNAEVAAEVEAERKAFAEQRQKEMMTHRYVPKQGSKARRPELKCVPLVKKTVQKAAGEGARAQRKAVEKVIEPKQVRSSVGNYCVCCPAVLESKGCMCGYQDDIIKKSTQQHLESKVQEFEEMLKQKQEEENIITQSDEFDEKEYLQSSLPAIPEKRAKIITDDFVGVTQSGKVKVRQFQAAVLPTKEKRQKYDNLLPKELIKTVKVEEPKSEPKPEVKTAKVGPTKKEIQADKAAKKAKKEKQQQAEDIDFVQQLLATQGVSVSVTTPPDSPIKEKQSNGDKKRKPKQVIDVHSAPPKNVSKTRACKFVGKCKRADCPYAHSLSELRRVECFSSDRCKNVCCQDNGSYTNSESGKVCMFWHLNETPESFCLRTNQTALLRKK